MALCLADFRSAFLPAGSQSHGTAELGQRQSPQKAMLTAHRDHHPSCSGILHTAPVVPSRAAEGIYLLLLHASAEMYF